MHAVAASRFSNTISEMTDGLAVNMMQLRIFPIDAMACLMSSAVVPGAKLLACTTAGAADPRI